jgi:hypothetical protein
VTGQGKYGNARVPLVSEAIRHVYMIKQLSYLPSYYIHSNSLYNWNWQWKLSAR